uniref:Uncharacterized protein n=1 Tax=Avena sativa TaxID=4498 RepID=A0ACD5TMW2_AVESA
MVRLIILAILFLAAHAAVGAAGERPKDEDPCNPSSFASEINLECTNRVSPTEECCDPVIASVDINGTGTTPCLCRVAAEPQLIMDGLNTDGLLAIFATCRAVAPGGAPLEVFCEGVADSPPPPTTASPNTTAMATMCDAHSLALQLGDFCSNEVVTSRCCKAVMVTVNRDNSAEAPCLCQVTEEWSFLSSGLGIDSIIDLYDRCTGRQGIHRPFEEVCGW